jgi:hypothetical protein
MEKLKLKHVWNQLNLKTPLNLQASSMVEYGTNSSRFTFNFTQNHSMIMNLPREMRFMWGNLKFFLREFFYESLDLDLKTVVNDQCSCDYDYICLVNESEIMLKPKLNGINKLQGVCINLHFHLMHEMHAWTVLQAGPNPLKKSPCTLWNWYFMHMITQIDFSNFPSRNFMNK